MNEKGLEAVTNPSALFLTNRDSSPGVSSAVTVQMEGTRPLLLEIQALCSPIQVCTAFLPCECCCSSCEMSCEFSRLLLLIPAQHTPVQYESLLYLLVPGPTYANMFKHLLTLAYTML